MTTEKEKIWTCLICKEEHTENEMCKCMRDYLSQMKPNATNSRDEHIASVVASRFKPMKMDKSGMPIQDLEGQSSGDTK